LVCSQTRKLENRPRHVESVAHGFYRTESPCAPINLDNLVRWHFHSIDEFNTLTSEVKRFQAGYFAEGTGHGRRGYLAGADRATQKEDHWGMSNRWRWKETGQPQPFPEAREFRLD
jgi:hypothetical protein